MSWKISMNHTVTDQFRNSYHRVTRIINTNGEHPLAFIKYMHQEFHRRLLTNSLTHRFTQLPTKNADTCSAIQRASGY